MKKLILFFTFYLLYSCAVIVAPTGGPKDTTPPKIITFYPNNYATNYSDDYVSIQFDKYMNKSSVVQSFSISPEIKYDFSWSGKTLNIEFEEELKESTTYVAKLNTGYTDFKGNKPENALTFIFTKGDKIDKGVIKGKLLDSKSEGKQVFAWRDNEIPFDIFQKPDYSVSLGTSGEFELIGLRKGLYRVIAIDDKFKDGVYNSGIDGFGAMQYDIEVEDSSETEIQLKISPPFDRVGPGINSAFPIASNIIQISLTEPVFTDSLSISNFILNNNSPILSVFSNDFPLTKKVYLLTNILDTNANYDLKINGLRDTLANLQVDSLSNASFRGIDKKYSKKLELLTKKIESKVIGNHLDLIFNHPISNLLDSALLFINTKDSTKLLPKIDIKSNQLEVDLSKLKFNEKYSLKIELARVKDFKETYGIDTTFSFEFTYIEVVGKSKLSGLVTDSTNYKGSILVLLKKGEELVSSFELNNSKFEFDNLSEADYSIEIVFDENNNGKYDFGNDFPFNFSEIFYLYDKILKVKENWDIEDINIILK